MSTNGRHSMATIVRIVAIFLCAHHTLIIAGSPGDILQLDFPNVTIAAQDNGTLLGQSGENGDIYIGSPNTTGTILFDGYDLLEIIGVINNMPPIWRFEGEVSDPGDVGYSGTFYGGSDLDILLKVLDPEDEGVRFELVAGDFPTGLNIAQNPWRIHGIVPDVDAVFSFTIRAIDGRDKYADAVFKIQTIEANQCIQEPCHNNGQCNNTNSHRGYVCICPGEYGGPACDVVCNATTLGVSNQSMIPDAQLAAYLSRYTSKATDGRLTAGAWCGENEFSWLQIDLGRPARIVRLVTQGANSSFFTKTYTVSYSSDGTTFKFINDVNSTSIHTYTGSIGQEYQTLDDPVEARFVRFHPKTYVSSSHPCMKVEMFGCWSHYSQP